MSYPWRWARHARGVGRLRWPRGGRDASTGAQVQSIEGGHGDKFALSVALSGDGTRVASGGRDGRVVVWDASEGAGAGDGGRAWARRCQLRGVAIDGTRVASGVTMGA